MVRSTLAWLGAAAVPVNQIHHDTGGLGGRRVLYSEMVVLIAERCHGTLRRTRAPTVTVPRKRLETGR